MNTRNPQKRVARIKEPGSLSRALELAEYMRLESPLVAVRTIGRHTPSWFRRRNNPYHTGARVELELKDGARHVFGGRWTCYVLEGGEAGLSLRSELDRRRGLCG